jgi:phage tail-like protein
MSDFGFTEAFRTDEFVVEIEGIESPGITKVSGLSEGEVEAIDQPDGGANITHKISSGIIKYDDLTLERNMDGTKADADFKDWFSEMFKLDGTGTGSRLRRNGSVVKKQFGVEVMRRVDQVVQVHGPGRRQLGADEADAGAGGGADVSGLTKCVSALVR